VSDFYETIYLYVYMYMIRLLRHLVARKVHASSFSHCWLLIQLRVVFEVIRTPLWCSWLEQQVSQTRMQMDLRTARRVENK